jgi:hypothetical protein
LLGTCAFTVPEIDNVFRELGWATTDDTDNGARAMRRLRARRRGALQELEKRTRERGGTPPHFPQPSDGQRRSVERIRRRLSDLRLLHRGDDPPGYLRVVRTIDEAGERRAEAIAVDRAVARIRDLALHPLLASELSRSPTFRRRCVEAEIARLRAVNGMAPVEHDHGARARTIRHRPGTRSTRR